MPTAPPPLSAALVAAQNAADRPVQTVSAPDTPVRLTSLRLLNTGSEPLVLLYAANNPGDAAVEVFTVMVFVFSPDGQLKARQVAPGRRELAAHETKYSAMVLDVGKIEPTDVLMAGIDQVQRAGSDDFWRTDLRALAEAAFTAQTNGKKPGAK